MYFVNTYRWDFPLVAALCAPRPLMLGNSNADDIFPLPGYRRLAEKVRRIYDLLGAKDRFVLLETAGPHKDTPELRLGAYGWMNRWLKHDPAEPVSEQERPRFTPAELKVFSRLPDDARNATIHETFLKAAHPQLPEVAEVAREWWTGQSEIWRTALRTDVFHGWPERPTDLAIRPAGEIKHNGLRLRSFDFTTQEGVDLRLWLLTAEQVEKPSLMVLTAVDEAGWQEWLSDLGRAFKDALQVNRMPEVNEKKFTQNRTTLAFHKWAFATIAPRGVGPTRWADSGTPVDIHVRRRFALLGQTLDGQRVWDVRRGVAVLRTLPDLKGVPLWLQGRGDMAGIVLYAAIHEPEVARLDLWHPPATHAQGPIFLNVRRIFDLPQALALAFPKQIRIYIKDENDAKAWEWPLRLQKSLGQEYIKIRHVGEW
jgi:hypothetical protein